MFTLAGQTKAEHSIVTDDDDAKRKAYISMLSFLFAVVVWADGGATVFQFFAITEGSL